MLINRNNPGRAVGWNCPHCEGALAGRLVHIEGLTFLCDRCLYEIHLEPRNRGRLSLIPRGRNRREPAAH
jgi:hypothetical protein